MNVVFLDGPPKERRNCEFKCFGPLLSLANPHVVLRNSLRPGARMFRLKTVFYLMALLLCSFSAMTTASAKSKKPVAEPFAKSEQILKWINGYRAEPEPGKLPTVVRAMSRLGLFLDHKKAGVYVGFIAGVLGSNPLSAERLVAQSFPLPPSDQVVLIKAIAYSGLANWRGVLSGATERMPARKVLIRHYLYGEGKALKDLPMDEEPFVLDVHWGRYFATGNQEPIHRIVSALAWSTEQNKLERLTIGSMAKWTLASNASRDKDLLDALKAEMNIQPGNVREPLREVIMASETFETETLRKKALASIETLKARGPQSDSTNAWWGKAGQTALALGCITAGALGHVEVGVPCVIGGALSSAALNLFGPGSTN